MDRWLHTKVAILRMKGLKMISFLGNEKDCKRFYFQWARRLTKHSTVKLNYKDSQADCIQDGGNLVTLGDGRSDLIGIGEFLGIITY